MRELEFIERVLAEVSPYAAERYAERANIAVTSKTGANDLLTEADLEIQKRIESALRRAFPHDHLVAEEAGLDRLPEDARARCWYVDPIDGTQNFVRGLFPEFGISIAFAVDGQVRAGGVAVPLQNDLYLARRDGGAFRNGEPLRVSSVPVLANARVEVDFGNQNIREDTLRRFGGVITRAGQMRCHCAAVIGLCTVATGDADAYFHVSLAPWDYAAALLIVEEAGGRATNLHGRPVLVHTPRSGILATNGLIHDEALRTIRT